MTQADQSRFTAGLASIGWIFFAVGSLASGVIDLLWNQFEPAHRPIQAWGDHIPGLTVLVWACGICFIVASITVLLKRTRGPGALLLTVLYVLFAVFPMPRLLTAPRVLGHHFSVYVVLLVTIFQQLILAIAAAASVERVSSSSVPHAQAEMWLLRVLFSLALVDFGLAHFTSMQNVVPMIPAWMPLGGAFWTLVTGAAFILFGLAILLRKLDVLAAQGLGFMLLSFSAVVLLPGLAHRVHSQIAWGGNAYNFAAVGAAWIFASRLLIRKSSPILGTFETIDRPEIRQPNAGM